MRFKKIFLASVLTVVAVSTHAFLVSNLSPQGEVAQVRQVVAKFSEAAVNFGDPKAATPLTISCSDAQASKGKGRWISEREWAFEFERDLPPGVACTMQLRPGLKSLKGVDLASPLQVQHRWAVCPDHPALHGQPD